MSDALSVLAAAREAPTAIAVRGDGFALTYAELARRVGERLRTLEPALRPGRPHPLVGEASLEAAITLYALLECRVPALLLHPRWTTAEREALLADVEAAGELPERDLAAILFTSGTTGRPRAALLGREAFLASAQASEANLGWRDYDCWLLCLSIAHVGGLSILTRALAARRTAALGDRFDAVRLPSLIDVHRATLVSLVPTMLAKTLDAHPDWQSPPWLRAILLGGAATSPRLIERAAARGLPLIVSYGLTEGCSQLTATHYEARRTPFAEGDGYALPGAELRIVDGRIHVRGPMLMRRYLGEPSRSADAWFDTGDLGSLDADGRLTVHARRTDLIVTGGENVYPAEVENVLECCPGIAAAGVFGVGDELWGQTIAAALVPAARRRPSDAMLREHLASRLAGFKRPRRICFVPELPQTASGKLDRRALAGFADALRPLRSRG